MPHIYHLSLDTSWEVIQLESFLIEHHLITKLQELSSSPNDDEKVVVVTVPNKRNFERYLNKKRNRIRFDPRNIIRTPIYKGKIISKTKKEKNKAEIRELKKTLDEVIKKKFM